MEVAFDEGIPTYAIDRWLLALVTAPQTSEKFTPPPLAGVIMGLFLLCLSTFATTGRTAELTFCNPLNLNYKLQRDPAFAGSAPYREAADPSVVIYQGEYWLFASVSGGYWHSFDLAHWKFLATTPEQLPGSDCSFAPTAVVIDDTLFVLFRNQLVCATKTPLDAGSWHLLPNTRIGDDPLRPDPQFFYDEDTRHLWLTFGCNPHGYIQVEELDSKTFVPKGAPKQFMLEDSKNRGWERPGKHNEIEQHGWTEGSQMLKHSGKYYLIYSLPALDNSYANGVYVGNSPLGPLTFASYSPFAQKLTGFIGGAGHGQVFEDMHGNWWNATCQDVYVLHRFERRLGLYPSNFTASGQLVTDTLFGDYPTRVLRTKREVGEPTAAGWALLSRGRAVTASSSLTDHPADLADDEDIRTWWSATSGRPGEWLQIDLGASCTINAIQTNFAEQNLASPEDSADAYMQYHIETSQNGHEWTMAVDKRTGHEDTPHDYVAFDVPLKARYVRIVNQHMPWGGAFAVRDLRIFGLGAELPPAAVTDFSVERNATDPRDARLSWAAVPMAEGYTVRHGVSPDLLYSSDTTTSTSLDLGSLNRGVNYYFTVDSYNRSGYRRSTKIESADDASHVPPRVVNGE